ncbi:MAG: FAD/NAD(P)-binding oxidoreductase [Pseudomonadota bacterium]
MARPRIVIVGAGPAGTRAALTLARKGLRPTVIDEGERSGGQIYRRPPKDHRRSHKALYGDDAKKAEALHQAFDAAVAAGQVDHRPSTLAWAVREGHLHLACEDEIERLGFDALILSVGATDRVAPVRGWTLPGVYTLGAAQIALKAQGCGIGQRVAFVGSGPLLYLVAYQYLLSGAPPAAVVDTDSFARKLASLPFLAVRPMQLLRGAKFLRALKRAGVPLMMGAQVHSIEADGDGAAHHVCLKTARGEDLTVACDGVGIGHHLRAETQLADLAGCDFAFRPASRQWLPVVDAMGRSSVPGVYLAGDGARLMGADAAETAGELAALAALSDLGLAAPGMAAARLRLSRLRHIIFAAGVERGFAWPAAAVAGLDDGTMLCRCEAITVAEQRRAATALDASEVNRAKAFSRVGMGRCQGRYCALAAAEIVAAARAEPIAAAGRIRAQAPVKPVPFAARPRHTEDDRQDVPSAEDRAAQSAAQPH